MDASIGKINNSVFSNELHGAYQFEEVEFGQDRVAVSMFCQYRDVSIRDSLAVKGEKGFAMYGFNILRICTTEPYGI